ncbi:hypothetical protein FRC11_013903 [Ceratobasidium sp. 423]|nr:hypothetical protein FRC11_013903 [Ceratobasidium sp. 423]
MKLPQLGANVGLCGVLSDISMHKEITSIKLDSIMFLPCTDFSHKDEGSTQGSIGARTKCQLMSEKAKVVVDVGQPMKKMRSGPIEVFTPEELGVGSSQSSVGSSSPPNMTTPQSSVGSSVSLAKGSTKKNV